MYVESYVAVALLYNLDCLPKFAGGFQTFSGMNEANSPNPDENLTPLCQTKLAGISWTE